MELIQQSTRKLKTGGYERRSAERYEDRMPSDVKDAQREVVRDWLLKYHQDGERLLSLPDVYWTFENRLAVRPNTNFLGVQRDWTSLERGLPWMPDSESMSAAHFYAKTPSGDVQGYRRNRNVVFYMWAGHLLAWDNLGRGLGVGTMSSAGLRQVTAAWLDFTGFLTDEVIAASTSIPVFLGGKQRSKFPVVTTFLAARDKFSSHEERVAHFLIAIQQAERRSSSWTYRFDRFEVHMGTSPFISVFGVYSNSRQQSLQSDRQGAL